MADVVDGVVIADELDAIGYRLDEVFFFDEDGHGDMRLTKGNVKTRPTYRPAALVKGILLPPGRPKAKGPRGGS
ncbi:hypothetical protein WJ973_31175 [Achromobacter xylosoxidans]